MRVRMPSLIQIIEYLHRVGVIILIIFAGNETNITEIWRDILSVIIGVKEVPIEFEEIRALIGIGVILPWFFVSFIRSPLFILSEGNYRFVRHEYFLTIRFPKGLEILGHPLFVQIVGIILLVLLTKWLS